MQEQRSPRESEQIEHRARDSLKDRVRIGQRHQLVDLFEKVDFCFQLGCVDSGVDQITSEGEVLVRLGQERFPVDVNLSLPSRR